MYTVLSLLGLGMCGSHHDWLSCSCLLSVTFVTDANATIKGSHFTVAVLHTWQVLHITWQVLHITWQVLHTTWQVLHTTWQVLHTTWQVLHITWQVLQITWQVLHTTWQVLHTTWQVLHITWQILHTTWQVLHTTWQVLHTTWQVLHTTWQVLHTTWQVLHTTWQVLHTTWQVLHITWQVLHITWQVLHTGGLGWGWVVAPLSERQLHPLHAVGGPGLRSTLPIQLVHMAPSSCADTAAATLRATVSADWLNYVRGSHQGIPWWWVGDVYPNVSKDFSGRWGAMGLTLFTAAQKAVKQMCGRASQSNWLDVLQPFGHCRQSNPFTGRLG